jgi:hypothetical protein
MKSVAPQQNPKYLATLKPAIMMNSGMLDNSALSDASEINQLGQNLKNTAEVPHTPGIGKSLVKDTLAHKEQTTNASHSSPLEERITETVPKIMDDEDDKL